MSADPSRRVVRIGTRESALAMWQAVHVKDILSAAYPDIEFKIVGMTTIGDKDQLKPLSSFESKGVFTKELDTALLNNDVDIVVHCMKDLATTLPDGIEFCAVMERDLVADSVILHEKHIEAFKAASSSPSSSSSSRASIALSCLPAGALVGTSALRRRASIARFHPHLACDDIRGNVGTRLSKLDAGQYDALILAHVGLKRLGLAHRVACELDDQVYMHAVGQGALAIVCRIGDSEHGSLVRKVLNHARTEWACATERGMLNALQGGCKVPIAVVSHSVRVSAAHAAEYIKAVAEARDEVIASRKQGGAMTMARLVPLPTESKAENEGENDGEAKKDNDSVLLTVTRGCVMSLDGQQVIECAVAAALDESEKSCKEGESNTQTCWKLGFALGDALRALGAEAILNDIKK